LDQKGLSGEPALFAGSLVKGVMDNRQAIDEKIALYAPAFPVDQLSPIDRNILRLAFFEMQISVSAPPRVVVNEAVELAKEFGAATSPKFVNGVLGSVITGMPKQAKKSD
jgi:N utilization substance protein B